MYRARLKDWGRFLLRAAVSSLMAALLVGALQAYQPLPATDVLVIITGMAAFVLTWMAYEGI